MRRYVRVVFFLFITHSTFSTIDLHAQSDEQIWLEYMLNYPFANSWNMENAFAYNTTISSPKWRSYEYSLTLERTITQHFEVIAQNVLSYTRQTDSYNTLEVRPVVGTRFYLTPSHRIQTRLLLRV